MFSKPLFLAFLFIFISSTPVHATSDYMEITIPDSSYERVIDPKLEPNGVVIDGDDIPPKEPNVVKTKFIAYPVTIPSINERVERLVHGINMYINPEQDYYGHEIRRYMAHVGNTQIFKDPDFLLEQYRNVKKSAVITQYWRKHLNKEISEIDEILENDSSLSLSVRTTYRQNKSTALSFIYALTAWIESNEQFLEEVAENLNYYKLEYPMLIITSSDERVSFFNSYAARQSKLRDIHKYSSFSVMVY